jgi:hypothetical protein
MKNSTGGKKKEEPKFKFIQKFSIDKGVVSLNGNLYNGFTNESILKLFKSSKNSDIYYYKGPFVNGKKHGMGICVFKDGNIYQGEWNDDEPNGMGIMKYLPMDKIENYLDSYWNYLDSYWIKGINQKGTYEKICNKDEIDIHIDGDIYEGEWGGGKKHGAGKQIFANGDIYKGEWRGGKKHAGKQIFVNGDIYEGEWRGGKKHAGKQIFVNGDI